MRFPNESVTDEPMGKGDFLVLSVYNRGPINDGGEYMMVVTSLITVGPGKEGKPMVAN